MKEYLNSIGCELLKDNDDALEFSYKFNNDKEVKFSLSKSNMDGISIEDSVKKIIDVYSQYCCKR